MEYRLVGGGIILLQNTYHAGRQNNVHKYNLPLVIQITIPISIPHEFFYLHVTQTNDGNLLVTQTFNTNAKVNNKVYTFEFKIVD